jgi:hypothetical protein
MLIILTLYLAMVHLRKAEDHQREEERLYRLAMIATADARRATDAH